MSKSPGGSIGTFSPDCLCREKVSGGTGVSDTRSLREGGSGEEQMSTTYGSQWK